MLGGGASSAGTSLLYCGEMLDEGTGWYYNRARFYDPATGRFNKVDPYAGNMYDPLSLHKYIYCHNDPVNGIDPSGLWTLMQITVVSAIIGGMIGLMCGAYIGYQDTGKLASWHVVWYAFLGMLTGAAIGAMIGAGVGAILSGGGLSYGTLNSIAKVCSKLIQEIAFRKLLGVTLWTFFGGIIAGAMAWHYVPDQWHEWITPASMLTLPADCAVLIIWNLCSRSVPGFAQESLIAIAGFNLGYFGMKALGEWDSILGGISDGVNEALEDENSGDKNNE